MLYAPEQQQPQAKQNTLANVIFIINRLLLLCSTLTIQYSAVNTCKFFFSLLSLSIVLRKPSRGKRMHDTLRAMPMQTMKSDFRFLFFSSVDRHLSSISIFAAFLHDKPEIIYTNTSCIMVIH